MRGRLCGADRVKRAGDDACPLSPTILLPSPPVTTHAAEAEAERVAAEKAAAEAERTAAESAETSQELNRVVAFLFASARAAIAAAHAAAAAAESQSAESKAEELEEVLERVMVEKAGSREKLASMRMQIKQAGLRQKAKAKAEADATETGGVEGVWRGGAGDERRTAGRLVEEEKEGMAEVAEMAAM